MKKIIHLITAITLSGAVLVPAEDEITVFFNRPGDRSYTARYGPEQGLIGLIDAARVSIDGAFYDLSSPAVAAALVKAKKRGVAVKLVSESATMGSVALSSLLDAGIPVRGDEKAGLMHNKFAVVDGERVWTGSYNATENGGWKNNNNALLIRSKALAKIYLDEFSEMFDDGIFGNRDERSLLSAMSNRYYVKLRDMNINVYFSPENNVEDIILKRIKKADKSVHFMAFSFTSDRLGDEMIRLHRKGIRVFGLFEAKGTRTKHSEYMKMKVEGLPVKKDTNPHAMHHKVIVIDESVVITGSYNFSENARKKNDENILIIESRAAAKLYLEEFFRLYR